MKTLSKQDAFTVAYAYFENSENKAATAKQLGISRSSLYQQLNDETVKATIDMITNSLTMADIKNEPALLKAWMMNVVLADMGDYFDTQNRFIGWENLTAAQRARIKEFEVKNGQYGQNVKIKLHDAMKANELLAKQHGIYNEISINLGLADVIDCEDFEYLNAKYGWDKGGLNDDNIYK